MESKSTVPQQLNIGKDFYGESAYISKMVVLMPTEIIIGELHLTFKK